MTDKTLLERLREAVADAAERDMIKLGALIKEAADEIEENDKLQAMRWDADMRGVAMWRADNPGNELVLPDRAEFAKWSLSKLASQAADIETLTWLAKRATQRGWALSHAAAQFTIYAREHHDKALAALNAGDVGLSAIARGKAKVNERFAAVCRAALGDEVEMTAGDLGGVATSNRDAIEYPAWPALGTFCFPCRSQYDCEFYNKCQRKRDAA